MSLQVEKLEKNMAKLTIEVSAEELEKAIQGAYLKQRGKISVPGFRKGKVPRQMIEKMYGVEIFYEDAANALIPEAYAKAYDEIVFSKPGVYKYSAPWFDHIEEDTREWFGNEGEPMTQDFYKYLDETQFDSLRNSDFFVLLKE